MAEGGEGASVDITEENPLVKIFGEIVLRGDTLEQVPVTDLGGEGKVVGVYFSGHWCPPCKQFTPLLSEWYEKFKAGPNGDKLEIVFVSSDKNEMDFVKYFLTMPWTALPYAERDRKASISAMYNISGIPVLVLLNGADASVITLNGRSIVTEDENGEDFPWLPLPVLDLLHEAPLIKCSDGKEVDPSVVDGKKIGLFSGAVWCTHCIDFLVQLKEVYAAVNDKNKGSFEIVFVTSDRTIEDFNSFIKDMPWYALPFDGRRKHRMCRTLKVEALPSLCTVDEKGKIINDLCRSIVEQDTTGKNFPWYPKPVSELDDEVVDQINEFPCIVLLTKKSQDALDNSRFILELISEAYHKSIGDKEEEKKNKTLIQFYYGGITEGEDDVGDQLRTFADLPMKLPVLAIIDLPNAAKYVCDKKTITKQVVSDFLNGYRQGTLPKQDLELD
ncbi:PREDICTED: nucleoredoxin-like [Amphimedon queenslandica]|uniref:Thioredoxin domain-containing protein n=1 Tax=Amphimedon queenslandica TaxID=400682 RepID=A0A1X7VK43_AMPQE|nr:PREDICTED: nucleoredoxin-like [Amphimedon queenslandica]|eukprot:XP_011410186.1 PREDICTED: nucleoredoxin-like [Amphimedon queenslandica]